MQNVLIETRNDMVPIDDRSLIDDRSDMYLRVHPRAISNLGEANVPFLQ